MARKTVTPTGPTHNGRAIVGTKIEIRKTGGEFSEDLLVANAELLKDVVVGQEITVAMRLVAVDEHFPAEDRKEPADGGVTWKLVFDPREVTIVDPQLVQAQFEKQREVLQLAKDAADGNTTINSQILAASHEAGEHAAGLVNGCPECEHETDLAAAGN